MLEPDLIELLVVPLNRSKIRYLVTGSVAAMLYGEPRVTHDVDLIVFLRSNDVAQLSVIFPSPEFYVPAIDVLYAELALEQKGQFNVIHIESGLKADFYLAKRDELDAWAFRNGREYSINNFIVRLAPPEYVIVRKLEFFREGGSEKHLRDIRAMMSASGETIDHQLLEQFVQQRALKAQWQRVSV